MIVLPTVEGGWRTVVADPAWKFDNTASRGAAEDHYATMTLEEIIYMPVREIVAKDAHLYLWTTDTHLEVAHHVARAWSFTPKQTLVWVKTTNDGGGLRIGNGNYYRHAHELVLFCSRGRALRMAKNLPSVFFAPRAQEDAHSTKPEKLQDMAEQLSFAPGLELFARRVRPGWTAWGNDPKLSSPSPLVARGESLDVSGPPPSGPVETRPEQPDPTFGYNFVGHGAG